MVDFHKNLQKTETNGSNSPSKYTYIEREVLRGISSNRRRAKTTFSSYGNWKAKLISEWKTNCTCSRLGYGLAASVKHQKELRLRKGNNKKKKLIYEADSAERWVKGLVIGPKWEVCHRVLVKQRGIYIE